MKYPPDETAQIRFKDPGKVSVSGSGIFVSRKGQSGAPPSPGEDRSEISSEARGTRIPWSMSFFYYKTKMDQLFAYTLIDLYLAVLSLRCCGGFPLVAASQGYSLVAVLGLLTAVTSPGVAPGLWSTDSGAVALHLSFSPAC